MTPHMTPCYSQLWGEVMSRWNKLIDEILKINKGLRFDDLAKALIRIGYTQSQPKGGGSHFVFRKDGKNPISLPKSSPMNKAYVELVRDAVKEYESEV